MCFQMVLKLVHCRLKGGAEINIDGVGKDKQAPQAISKFVRQRIGQLIRPVPHSSKRGYEFRKVADIASETIHEIYRRPRPAVSMRLNRRVASTNLTCALCRILESHPPKPNESLVPA